MKFFVYTCVRHKTQIIFCARSFLSQPLFFLDFSRSSIHVEDSPVVISHVADTKISPLPSFRLFRWHWRCTVGAERGEGMGIQQEAKTMRSIRVLAIAFMRVYTCGRQEKALLSHHGRLTLLHIRYIFAALCVAVFLFFLKHYYYLFLYTNLIPRIHPSNCIP